MSKKQILEKIFPTALVESIGIGCAFQITLSKGCGTCRSQLDTLRRYKFVIATINPPQDGCAVFRVTYEGDSPADGWYWFTYSSF
jgi:hypothetical protein